MQHESLDLRACPQVSAKRVIFVLSCANIKQLSLQQRHKIKALLDEDLNQTQIADNIGAGRSTISRELNRNVTNPGPPDNSYYRGAARQLTDRRHADKPKHCRFTDELKRQVRWWLTEEKLSSELISGRWQTKTRKPPK